MSDSLPQSIRRFAQLLFAVASLRAPHAIAQSNYIVDTLSDSVDAAPGDGICLDANGFCSLRAAIMEANQNAGVVNIFFAPNGTHTLAIGGIEDGCTAGDLDINPVGPLTELNIIGNGIGNTVISAAGLPAAAPDRVFHVPAAAPAGLRIRMSNLMIRNGRAAGLTGVNGGGMLAQGGVLDLLSVEVRDCSATTDGGGIWSNRDISIAIPGITLISNTAGDDGGGLYLESPATLGGGVTAELNIAGNRGGGARFSPGTTVHLQDLVIQFNEATQGGGVANSGQTIINFVIAAQNAAIGGGNGGAFANQNSGRLEIFPFALMLNNTADNGGGAINNQFNAVLRLELASLEENVATNLGGAIANAGDATLRYCDLVLNQCFGQTVNAAGGGAVYNQNGFGVIRATNCTFSANEAPLGYGGGVLNDFGARCELSACTFRENQGAVGDNLFNGNTLGSVSIMQVLGSVIDSVPLPPGNNVVAASPITSAGFNINSDGTGMLPAPGDQFGSVLMPIDSMLSPLTPCGALQAHFPLPGSPAIDLGVCNDLAGNVLFDDQCGNPRPTDGDGNGSALCDVGAVEAPGLTPPCPTCRGDMNGDNFVDGADVQGFANCIAAAPQPIIAPGCECVDMDFDGLFDLTLDLPLFVDKTLGIGDPNPACP